MPTYNFIDTRTNEEFTGFYSMSGKDEYLEQNQHIKQLPSLTAIGDPGLYTGMKPDDAFRDRLKEIKQSHRGATVQTW